MGVPRKKERTWVFLFFPKFWLAGPFGMPVSCMEFVKGIKDTQRTVTVWTPNLYDDTGWPEFMKKKTSRWWLQSNWNILYSQIGWFPQVGTNKNVWNHHLDLLPNFIDQHFHPKQVNENKKNCYFPLYRLFNTDPYNGLLQSSYILIYIYILTYPSKQPECPALEGNVPCQLNLE